MEAVGGLVGVTQDPNTLALRPKVGWAVRAAEKMDVMLARLSAEHKTFPAVRSDNGSTPASPQSWMNPDLAKFYDFTDGAEFIGPAREMACHILKAADLEWLDWGEIDEYLKDDDYPYGQIWCRLARLTDGSWLAINPQSAYSEEMRERFDRGPGSSRRDCAAICHCTGDTQGRPGMNPVVALSFTELLERLLQAMGHPYWLDPEFVSYGDAEQYTHRD
jgi:hypothetical protein